MGETWVPGVPGDRHRYTGHLRDAESENDYAGARYYANQRGRWLSVDPVLGDLSNPQRLNRYAYVLGDPVNFVDPDGANETTVTWRTTSEVGLLMWLEPFQYGVHQSREAQTRQAGPGGGGGFAAAKPWLEPESMTTVAFRKRGNNYIDKLLSDRCKEFLAAKGLPVEKIRKALGDLHFWDLNVYAMKEVGSLPGVVGTFAGKSQLGDWSGSIAGGILLRNDQGQLFPHVLFDRHRFGQRTTDPWHPDLDPFHEALHWASGKGDLEFARDLLG